MDLNASLGWKNTFCLILIMCVAGIIFYLLYPKYYWDAKGQVRINKITGTMEVLSEDEGWENLARPAKRKKSPQKTFITEELFGKTPTE